MLTALGAIAFMFLYGSATFWFGRASWPKDPAFEWRWNWKESPQMVGFLLFLACMSTGSLWSFFKMSGRL